jgi:hypothetical protein
VALIACSPKKAFANPSADDIAAADAEDAAAASAAAAAAAGAGDA